MKTRMHLVETYVETNLHVQGLTRRKKDFRSLNKFHILYQLQDYWHCLRSPKSSTDDLRKRNVRAEDSDDELHCEAYFFKESILCQVSLHVISIAQFPEVLIRPDLLVQNKKSGSLGLFLFGIDPGQALL